MRREGDRITRTNVLQLRCGLHVAYFVVSGVCGLFRLCFFKSLKIFFRLYTDLGAFLDAKEPQGQPTEDVVCYRLGIGKFLIACPS